MHLDPWDHLVLLVREVLVVAEDQREGEECLAWRGHLVHLVDKVFLAEQVVLENLARLVDQGDHTLRMI